MKATHQRTPAPSAAMLPGRRPAAPAAAARRLNLLPLISPARAVPALLRLPHRRQAHRREQQRQAVQAALTVPLVALVSKALLAGAATAWVSGPGAGRQPAAVQGEQQPLEAAAAAGAHRLLRAVCSSPPHPASARRHPTPVVPSPPRSQARAKVRSLVAQMEELFRWAGRREGREAAAGGGGGCPRPRRARLAHALSV